MNGLSLTLGRWSLYSLLCWRAWRLFVDDFVDLDRDAVGVCAQVGPLFVAVSRINEGGQS